MSHLSTIISRIEREVERFDDPLHEGSIEKHIENLREYTQHWDDATEEELERRDELLREKPWIADSHFKVECLNEDCDWEDTADTEEAAARKGNAHKNAESSFPDEHATWWDHVVVEPAGEA